jgi:putative spermidine/putrescine transport system substrate-binding protein
MPDWTDSSYTRRAAIQRGALGASMLALPAFLAACGKDDPAPAAGGSGGDERKITSKSVVYAFFGGDFGKAQQTIMLDTFADKYGVKVLTPPTDSARVRLMAERGKSQWDVTDSDGFVAAEWVNLDLLEKLPSWVTRCDLVDEDLRDYLSAAYVFSFVQGYVKSSFDGGGPQNWRDFWDVKKFPGKRTLPKYFSSVYEAALMADGVAPDALYPVDIDRALAKLDEIRDNVLFYDSYGQGAQFLAQGSVSIALLPASRVHLVGEHGMPTEIVWNEAIQEYAPQPVIKGAPHKDAAFALVDWMSDPKHQADLAIKTLNAPANSAAFDFIPKDVLPKLANSEEHTAVAAVMNVKELSKQYAEMSDRYTKWLAS